MPPIEFPKSREDQKLETFLMKVKNKIEDPTAKPSSINVAEFVSDLKEAFKSFQLLNEEKKDLENLIHLDPKTWNQKVKRIVKHQDALSNIMNKISDPERIKKIVLKLEKIKKKRIHIKRRKQKLKREKEVKLELRAKLHQDIDHWHEVLRGKDMQQKQETEMKKEADFILAEVRKKIQEAKRSFETLKKLEKARLTKKDNAIKKGIHLMPQCDIDFEAKLTKIRSGLTEQLKDYENEKRALTVMLETEQEGQRELEQEWRVKKLKALQDRKHANISSAFFGDSDIKPVENDMMNLFHQYYDSGNRNLEKLLDIRHTWDVHLVAPDDSEGTNIPHRWVVPSAPSSEKWASMLIN